MIPRCRTLLLLILCLSTAGCAWSNRDNRPVWNAFETNLVPEGDGAFYATLPLTIPGGLLAILTDTFLVHPLQVIDDAYDDTASLWRGLPWDTHYYTTSGFAPLRAVGTPLLFLGSFLGRSCFDVPSDEAVAESLAERQQRQHAAALAWLAGLAEDGVDGPTEPLPDTFDAELRAAVAKVQASANALGKARFYELASRRRQLADEVDWALALRDPSAVVRFRVLQWLPEDHGIPAELVERLRNDPDPAVRQQLARRLSK